MQTPDPEYLAAAADYEKRYGSPQERYESALENAENALIDNVRNGTNVDLPHVVHSPWAQHKMSYHETSEVIGDVAASISGASLLFEACQLALTDADLKCAAKLREFVMLVAKDYAINNAECYE